MASGDLSCDPERRGRWLTRSVLELHDPGIDGRTVAALARYQATVNAAGGYAEQVEAAAAEFKSRNRDTNAAFRVVRAQLDRMCASPGRCAWCEDSEAREIDHIRPKALYPGEAFSWPNLLRSCSGCNRAKGDGFALVDNDELLDVTRRPRAPVVPPPSGRHAVIDPRVEDPMRLLELDIAGGTFRLQPRFRLATAERRRADYTARLLKLNRPLLTSVRSTVYGDMRARLAEYRERRDAGATEVELARFVKALVEHPHPTVWREMQRQHGQIGEIDVLFRDVPEALGWQWSPAGH